MGSSTYTTESVTPDSIVLIQKLKEKGNVAHHAGNFSGAISEYSRALSYFQSQQTPSLFNAIATWFSNGITVEPPSTPTSESPTTTSFFRPLTPSNSEEKRPPTPQQQKPLERPKSPVAPPIPPTPPGRKTENSDQTDEDPTILLATLLSNRAASLISLRKFEEALEDAEQVVMVRPEWVKGHFRRGDALMGLGRNKEALASFEEALKIEPLGVVVVERIEKLERVIRDLDAGMLIYQWQCGRELGQKSVFSPIQSVIFTYASQFRNFIYAIGNRHTREVCLIDPCWDIDGILKLVKEESLTLVGIIVTHYHVDHVGGIPPPPFDQYRLRVDGLAKLLKKIPHIPVYINPNDISEVVKANPEIDVSRFSPTEDGQELLLGAGERGESEGKPTFFKFMHTPGHTPGSQCVLMNGERLFTGDTLFIGNCGRCDFPDSSIDEMVASLTRLAQLPDDVIVFPGHNYGGEWTSIEREKVTGMLRMSTLESWREHAHREAEEESSGDEE
ncbi:beta-lactamase-like protein [Cladochytrium replicatum]|nr:beta-lactamase-like protein [Cladochytrium replicatum]